MRCILCLNLEKIKAEQIEYDDYLLFRDYLFVCHQYLTVEIELGEFNDCTNEQKYNPICSKCFPSVKKLVELHNEILEYSNSFSKQILDSRNSDAVVADSNAALNDEQLEEKQPEIEDDDHEEIDVDSLVVTQLKTEEEEREKYEEEDIFAQVNVAETVDIPISPQKTKSVKYQVKKEKVSRKTLQVPKNSIPALKTKSKTVEIEIKPAKPWNLHNKGTRHMTKYIRESSKAEAKLKKMFPKNKKPVKMRNCDICETMVNVKLYHRHRLTMHSDKTFKCDIGDCQAVYVHQRGLSTHKTVKHKDDRIVCKYESCVNLKEFKKRGDLWHHYEYYHKPADEHHMCEHCGKSFNLRGRLTAHMRTSHNTNERHSCTYCDKSYGLKHKLEEHIKFVHTKEISYICELCGKSLSSKRMLKNHYRLHTGDKLTCDVCGQLYSSTTALITHRKKAHS